MEQLQEAIQLNESGLFRDALAVLSTVPNDGSNRIAVLVQQAELLERVGRKQESEALIQRLLRSRSLSANDRALCDFILARIRIELSDFDGAIAFLNRAITAASRAGDLERVCAAQLKLLVVLSDGIGTDAASPLGAEVRANAIKTGNPRILAAVHVYFAHIEALRSSATGARRHIKLALQLLKDAPNYWLESVIENIALVLSIITSEFDAAEIHARRGRELAERTGGAIECAVNQGEI